MSYWDTTRGIATAEKTAASLQKLTATMERIAVSLENTPNKRERFARCNRCAYRAERPTGECHCMSKASSQYGKEVTDQTGCLVGEES